MVPQGPRNDRDERGWRVPREGTRSRVVYDGVLAGRHAAEIAAELSCSVNNVSVLAHRFKNPDRVNAWATTYYRTMP